MVRKHRMTMRAYLICVPILAVSLCSTICTAQPPTNLAGSSSESQNAEAPLSFAGKITGHDSQDHRFDGKAGQKISVSCKSPRSSAYFNLLPPDSEEALFVGSLSGNKFEGTLPEDGQYTIRPYLMGSAKSENETVEYKIEVTGLSSDKSAPASSKNSQPKPLDNAPFDKKLDAMGITFHVQATTGTDTNTLYIFPNGLESDNTPIEHKIEGVVKDAEWGDINSDGSPEIYVFIMSNKPGSDVTLVAYSANNKKSLTEIYLPPFADDPKLSRGYNGQTELAVVENIIAQRFPLYSGSGPDAKPTGKMRQIEYQLTRGEAGWLLKVKNVEEF